MPGGLLFVHSEESSDQLRGFGMPVLEKAYLVEMIHGLTLFTLPLGETSAMFLGRPAATIEARQVSTS